MATGTKGTTSAITREVARIITQRIDAFALTKMGVAKSVGISRPMLVKMLDGTKHWDIDQLDRVCTYLGLHIGEVLDQADRATQKRSRVSTFEGAPPVTDSVSNVTPIRLNNVSGEEYLLSVELDPMQIAASDDDTSHPH